MLSKKLAGITANVIDEYTNVTSKFGPFASPHEGYAILLEEVDELWDEVKKRPDVRSPYLMWKEAIQVAAMALRFLNDCIPDEEPSAQLDLKFPRNIAIEAPFK